MKFVVFESTDSLKLLDTETGVWRAQICKTNGYPVYVDGHFDHYEMGDVVLLRTKTYVDAERVGVVGYMPHQVVVPLSVLLETADAIRAGLVPRYNEEEDGDAV